MFSTAMLAPLLKSFGLDPENVQQWVSWAQTAIPAWMQNLTAEFQAIKAQMIANSAKLDAIEKTQSEILAAVQKGQAQ